MGGGLIGLFRTLAQSVSNNCRNSPGCRKTARARSSVVFLSTLFSRTSFDVGSAHMRTLCNVRLTTRMPDCRHIAGFLLFHGRPTQLATCALTCMAGRLAYLDRGCYLRPCTLRSYVGTTA